MARFEPLGPSPHIAIAVSGGADSTALAVLAQSWAAQRGAILHAFIVDHRLRASATEEAQHTQRRLSAMGIAAEILTLHTLLPGAALQQRARIARYQALTQAAKAVGALFLLVGHHADDQSELIAMRAQRGPRGAQGMQAWSPRADLILLRPLLRLPRATLRMFLTDQAIPWIDDPSNANPAFERTRLRQTNLAVTPPSLAAIAEHHAEQAATAEALAASVSLRPEGFAVIDADHLPPEALSALIRVIGGALYPPPRAAIARLAGQLAPATLGGVQIARSRRLSGFILVREAVACAAPAPATLGALWDRRFLVRNTAIPAAHIGALGDFAARLRRQSDLPSLILRSLPALFVDQRLVAVPHLAIGAVCGVDFAPPHPATTVAWG